MPGPKQQLRPEGSYVVKLLDADPSKEIAVLGAIWVNARRSLYVQQVKNIEQFERGSAFRITKRVSEPPRAEDFAAASDLVPGATERAAVSHLTTAVRALHHATAGRPG